MNKRYGLRVVGYVAVFAGAWWLGARRDAGMGQRAAAGAPAVVPVSLQNSARHSKEQVRQQGNSTQQAGLEKLEGNFLRLVEKENRTFDGEGLLAACAMPFETVMPDIPEATAYATLWAESDPEGMFAWFQKRGSFDIRQGEGARAAGGLRFLEDQFGGWARVDPDRAAQAALACVRAGDRAPALAAVIGAVRPEDPVKALALLHAHMDLLEKSQENLFSAGGKEGEANFHLLQSLPDSVVKSKLLAGYLGQAVNYQEEKIASFWESLPAQTQREVVAAGFKEDRWHTRDLGASQDGGSRELSGLRELLYEKADAGTAEDVEVYLKKYGRRWAQSEPAAALTWAQDRLRGKERMQLLPRLYAEAAAGNLDAAMHVWEALPHGPMKARAAGGMAAGAPAERVAEVEAVIAGMSAEDQKDAAEVRGRVSSQR